MNDSERYIARWEGAGLLDDPTASAIRSYEAKHAKPHGQQWQVLAALILGAILLGAGVLLFVATHWAEVSPMVRLGMVLSMLIFFHGLGILSRERFSGFATAMHAVGTISAGAAIALVGQIFNMQEHWPAAVMLWALCALAGWMLLRDQFQETMTLLLVPAWILSEWTHLAGSHGEAQVLLLRIGLVVGAVYLTAFLDSRKGAVFGILFAAGAVLLPVCIGILAEEGWQEQNHGNHWDPLPLSYRLMAYGIMALAAVGGAIRQRRSVPPILTAAALGFALPWTRNSVTENSFGAAYTYSEPGVAAYAMVGIAVVSLIVWAVRSSSKALLNYGMVAFAMTVMWFYFSNVMGKLGRSLGLIGLGVLFLAGGWVLEQTRRRLVQRMAEGAA